MQHNPVFFVFVLDELRFCGILGLFPCEKTDCLITKAQPKSYIKCRLELKMSFQNDSKKEGEKKKR